MMATQGKECGVNIRTKEEIVQYMIKYTEKFRMNSDLTPFTTHVAADEIRISRNLASSYLNDLVKEGVLVKAGGRPVYFFHKKTLEKKYHLQLEENEFDYPEDLWEILAERIEGKDEENVIGFSATLNYCITQCKSAVKYPGCGVPVLIWGEAGTGKSYLANYLYHYAIENESIEGNAPYKIMECNEADGESEKDVAKLCGMAGSAGKRSGMLREAAGGVLLINNIDRLSKRGQEVLAGYLEERTSKNDEREAKLIMTTRKNPSLVLSESLLSQIPVISFLPPLRERSLLEKRLLLAHFFEKEEKHLGCHIAISSNVYRIFMKYPFEGNLKELKSCIKVICANAFLQADKPKELEIKSYHLPGELISSAEPEEEAGGDFGKIQVSNLAIQEEDNYLLPFLKRILNVYDEYRKNEISEKDLMRKGNEWLNEFYDFIVYEKKYSNAKITALTEVTGKVLAKVSKKHEIFLPTNCEFVLARLLYVMTGDNTSLIKWLRKKEEPIREFLLLLGEEYPAEAFMAKEMKRLLEEVLDVELEDINLIFLILNIKFYNRKSAGISYTGIVAAHGYSTASSIADAVNKLLGKRVLEAFDMPLATDVNEIILKIKEGLSEGRFTDNLILLVDMGTLEELGTIISECSSAHIGVINNISTKTALSVGEGILNGEKTEDILRRACEEAKIEYRLYDNAQRDAAILFTSESGTPMTNRVLQIFKDSFPKKMRVKLIAVDCSGGLHMEMEALCARYEILFISGTMDPQLPDIPYISLEDIITSESMEDMNRLLKRYMSWEELKTFDEKLVQNFTLQNVLQYLTILDADKLLGYIKIAVDQLQDRMDCHFSVKTIIGIYIHICCLMERLVTKTPITDYENLENFMREQPEFIHLLTESFRELTSQYNVELPISEIAYLHDYVGHDANVTAKEGEKKGESGYDIDELH